MVLSLFAKRHQTEGVRIGIDFGTTRVVVAAVDRGNYPLVNFETTDGQVFDWFPPVAALKAMNASMDGRQWLCRRMRAGPPCDPSSDYSAAQVPILTYEWQARNYL